MLGISLTADQYARKAEMQILLDTNNLACCLQGSFLLKLPGWMCASNSWYQKDSGHRVDAHGTGDFLIRQQFGLCIQDQYEADHWSHCVSLRGKIWISRHCCTTAILEQRWTRANVQAYSFRSQRRCCHDWPRVLLMNLFLSPQPSRIALDWLVNFFLPERAQMVVLGDCTHALRDISLCVVPNSSILSPLLFCHR